MPDAKPKPKGGGNALTRKGPGGLPMWVIVVGAAVAAYVGYRLYENYKANQSATAASTSSTTAPTDTSGLAAPTLGGTPASTDSGISGTGSSSPGPDQESADLLNLLQQQQGFNAQAFGTQEDLIAALASGAQQTAQAADAQLGSVAATAVEGLVTMATNQPSLAAATINPGGPSGPVSLGTHNTAPNPATHSNGGGFTFTPVTDTNPTGPQAPLSGGAPASASNPYGTYPQLTFTSPAHNTPTPAIASGAAAVKSGSSKTNYQARSRAV